MRRKLLLLASYCGADDQKCSDDFPCVECLRMCNVFVAQTDRPLELMNNIGSLEYNHTKEPKA